MTVKGTALLPALDGPCAEFWTAGAQGELRIGWCDDCSRYLHPSSELCPHCQSRKMRCESISGSATLISYTENHQAWLQDMPTPYWLGIVALDAAPEVRLTTRLTGLDGYPPRIGMRMTVCFERHHDVWLPFFTPTDDSHTPIDDPPPHVPVSRPATPDRFEERVVISGVGSSEIGRKLPRGINALAVDACRAAMEDAGLQPEDMDGVSAYPGAVGMPGVSSGGVRGLVQALHLRPVWHCGAHEVAGQTGALIEAMLAIASGLCRHVLCMTSFSGARQPWTVSPKDRIEGESAWRVPFGAMTPVNWIAMYATHYMHRYSITRETLGWIAISAHRYGEGNPEALSRQAINMDEYLSARMISTPFGRYDCDTPCDGAIAIVLSQRETAQALRRPPILIEAIGSQIAEPQFWDQTTLSHQVNVFGPSAHLWSRTDLRPDDVDIACLYDGFSFNVLCWLEALGFCKHGEAKDFIDDGRRIGPGGELPLNPHGGHLAAGRTNGYGHLREAVLQLRGDAETRQVPGAKLAVVSSGGGIPGGCMLLRRDH